MPMVAAALLACVRLRKHVDRLAVTLLRIVYMQTSSVDDEVRMQTCVPSSTTTFCRRGSSCAVK